MVTQQKKDPGIVGIFITSSALAVAQGALLVAPKDGMMQGRHALRKTDAQTLEQRVRRNAKQSGSLQGQHVDAVPHLILRLLTVCRRGNFPAEIFPLSDVWFGDLTIASLT